MRLIIREYLGMLRESGEFDELVPDLLLSMGIVPLTKPQLGVRQAGVDLAAVGKDSAGVQNLWLFILKRGDIGRRDWDSQPQAVRPSLEEVKDVYIRNHVDPQHSLLPIRIVVATTGDRKQEVDENWAGYVDQHTEPGRRDYEFWNGDKVAALVEQYLFDEYALPLEGRSELRRALALVGEPDYDLQDFHVLLKLLLNWETKESPPAERTEKECLRALTTTTLALGILCRWAVNEGNLKNAVFASERTLLWAWDAIRRRRLTENEDILHVYVRLIDIYLRVTVEYFNKVQTHFHVKDGLARYYQEAILLTEQVFEQIGLLSSIGLSHLLWAKVRKDEESIKSTDAIAETLKALIGNHGCSGSPCYDGHVTDIVLALFLLSSPKNLEFSKEWIRELIGRLNFSFRVGKWFPISTDSFDDLVEFEIDKNDCDKSKLKETSWMIPTLAQWAVILGEDETYKILVGMQDGVLKETCFQLWYPDEKTDNLIYYGPAHFESGTSEAPIALPATAEEMRTVMRKTRAESPVRKQVQSSVIVAGIPFLDFIACRHFRTPVDPAYWQVLVAGGREVENPADLSKEESGQ